MTDASDWKKGEPYIAHIFQLHFKCIGSSWFEQRVSSLLGSEQLDLFRLSRISKDSNEHSRISSSIDARVSDDRDNIQRLICKKEPWFPTHRWPELPVFSSPGSRSM